MAEDVVNEAQVDDDFPMPVSVDFEGASWEAPTWKPLAAAGGILGAGASAVAGGLFASKRRRGAAAAAAGGLAVAGSLYGVASRVVSEFLSAPHKHPLAADEQEYLAENPTGELAEHYRHVQRIGRMICGAQPDSWEGYYQALEPEEVERLRANRKAEEAATWAWSEGASYQQVSTQSDDGTTLVGHLVQTDPASKRWVVLAHGYHGTWADMSQYAHHWAEKGCNLLFPEMRGHGDSGGSLVGMGWLDRRDLVAWLGWLVAERGEDITIALHGHSMGGASVLLASAEEDLPAQVSLVVADCAYSDALNVLAPILREGFRIPVHPALELLRLVVRLKKGGYDLANASPETAAARIKVPVLLLHGERDTFVPPYMVRRIFEALPESNRRMATFPGAGHCQSMCSNPKRYWDEVFSFVEWAHSK